MNIQCEFYLLSVSSHTSCHQKNLQTFSREETVVLATPSYSEKHWKKEKGKKETTNILLPSDFHIFTNQSKAFLFNQNLTATCLQQFTPPCYSFSSQIASGLRVCPFFLTSSPGGTIGFAARLSCSPRQGCLMYEGAVSHSKTLMSPKDFLSSWHRSNGELGAIGLKQNRMGKKFCWGNKQ